MVKVSVSDPETLARSGVGRQVQGYVFHRLGTLLCSGIEASGGS